MPELYASIDVSKVRQLRPFKIDYSRVKKLEYIDKNDVPPQSFREYRHIVPPVPMQVEEQPRPAFPTDLRYLASYAALQFPKGKVAVLVNYDLYPSVKPALDQYVKDLAYEGYFATVYRVGAGSPAELRTFLHKKRPIVGALLVVTCQPLGSRWMTISTMRTRSSHAIFITWI